MMILFSVPPDKDNRNMKYLRTRQGTGNTIKQALHA